MVKNNIEWINAFSAQGVAMSTLHWRASSITCALNCALIKSGGSTTKYVRLGITAWLYKVVGSDLRLTVSFQGSRWHFHVELFDDVARLFHSGDKFAYGHHFVRPQDAKHAELRKFFPNELIATPFHEIVPLEAVVNICCVMDLETYCLGKPKGENGDFLVCDHRLSTRFDWETVKIANIDGIWAYMSFLCILFREKKLAKPAVLSR